MAFALVALSSVVTYFVTSKHVSERLLSSFSPIGVIDAAQREAAIEELIDTDAAYMRVGVGQGAEEADEAQALADAKSEADRQSAFLRRNLDRSEERRAGNERGTRV